MDGIIETVGSELCGEGIALECWMRFVAVHGVFLSVRGHFFSHLSTLGAEFETGENDKAREISYTASFV